MLENIDIGGIVIIIIIAIIIGGIFVIRRLLSGQGLSFKLPQKQKKAEAEETVLCFNIYPDKIRVESMLKKSIAKGVKWWDINGKPGVAQMRKTTRYEPLLLPDKVSFLPGTLARMLGCVPYQKLKSLNFSRWAQLAPFAPVAALIVAGIILVIIAG